MVLGFGMPEFLVELRVLRVGVEFGVLAFKLGIWGARICNAGIPGGIWDSGIWGLWDLGLWDLGVEFEILGFRILSSRVW